MGHEPALEFLSALRVPGGLVKEEYEYGADRQTLACFRAIPGATWLTKQVLEVQRKITTAEMLGTAVRVSSDQFADVHRIATRAAEVLQMKCPQLYIQKSEENDLNAFTFGSDSENAFVVVTTAMQKAATPCELAFVLGHEFGHIKSEHVLYHVLASDLERRTSRVGRKALDAAANAGLLALSLWARRSKRSHAKTIANAGSSVAVLLADVVVEYPLRLALIAWHRRSEITADRAGLIACQDEVAAQRALALVAFRDRTLADKLNLSAFAGQVGDGIEVHEFGLSHPYIPKRLSALRFFAQSHFYRRRLLLDQQSPFATLEDVDEEVGRLLRGSKAGEPKTLFETADIRRLRVAVAIAVAWEDGKISDEERSSIDAYLEELDFTEDEKREIWQELATKLDEADLERTFSYFQGNKRVGFAFALSILAGEDGGLTRSRKSLLRKIARACGLEADTTNGLLDSIKRRKEFIASECDLHYCSNCHRLYGIEDERCPACRVKANAVVSVVDDESRCFCRDCGVEGKVAEFSTCPACGAGTFVRARRATALN